MSVTLGKILGGFRRWAAGLVDLLLPGVCPGCETREDEEGGLCETCAHKLLSLVALRYCPRCGATMGPNIPVREEGCGACGTLLPRFARVVRLGPYADPLRHVIRSMKYRRRDAMQGRLARMLAEAVAAQCPQEEFDVVLSVPMHWRRRLQRGCDHARVLAETVAWPLGLPVGHELVRQRHTPPQVGLPKSRRETNLRGAFAVPRPKTIRGANILLIDDVTTTGATANEATRTLLNAGALRVTLAVLAKSEPPTAYVDRAFA